MRKVFFATAVLFLIALPVQASSANFSVGSWQASGYQMWRTSFPTAFSSPAGQRGASELYYPQTGTYIIGTYENSISKKRALRVETGFMGSLKSAVGSDSDWENQTDSAKWYYGEFTTSGTSLFINADWVQKQNAHIERYYGYSYRENSFVMTDGIYYLVNHVAQAPPLLLTDLRSTYKMIYQGPHIGWKYTSTPKHKLTAVGSLSYTPLAYIQGHGWWNLRSLDFTHTGPGQMLDTSLGIRYSPSGSATVTVGYRYQYHSLFRGWEDTNGDISWDKATNIQQGLYFSANLLF